MSSNVSWPPAADRKPSTCAIGPSSWSPSPPADGGAARSRALTALPDQRGRSDQAAAEQILTSPTVPCVRIALGRTKTTTAGQGAFVFAAGRAAVALQEWMQFAEITSGPIFREVRKDGSIGAKPTDPAVGQPHPEEALPDGRTGPGGVQRPRPAIGLHDPGWTGWDPACGRYAPVSPQVGPTGRRLLR